MEGCFIIKGMSIYLQFLKLKIMLFHFTILSIGNNKNIKLTTETEKTVNSRF